MFRAALALATLAVTVAILSGQERQPTFSSRTTLLTVDVTALDRDGKPVAGLALADFEVKLNGHVQRVQALAFLEASRVSTNAGNPTTVSIPGVTPRRSVANPTPAGGSRVFVIVVDDLSFEVRDGRALFVSAEDFVRRLPASDYVGYAVTSGSASVNPTRDRSAVLAALKSAVGRFANPARVYTDPPIIGLAEAMQADEGDSVRLLADIMLRECFDPRTAASMNAQSVETLQRVSPCAAVVPSRVKQIVATVKSTRTQQVQALATTIQSLAGVPGIKHLVILTSGVAVTKDPTEVSPVARAAAAAGVEISTMVQEGDIDLSDVGSSVEGGPVSPGQARIRREDDKFLFIGGQTMTDMAGGQFYRVVGQPRRFFDRVDISASAVYRLGVELPSDAAPGRELTIAARIKREGVTALASHHGAAPASAASMSPADRMKNAVAHGETLYGVPIEFGAIVRRAASPADIEIGAIAVVAAGVRGPLSATFGIVDEKGALKSGTKTLPASTGVDYRVPFALPVPPGNYNVRLAIADAAGNVGAVSMPIKAGLNRLAGLDASDLLTWVREADGRMQLLPLEELPPGTGALTGMVELYPPGSLPADITVRFAILSPAGQPLSERDATITPGSGVIRADASLDLAALPAGRYGLSATVSVSGTAAGTVTTTFRKK